MARLPYLSAEDLEPADTELLKRPIALFRVLANRPELLRNVDAMGSWVRWQTALDGRLRELAIVFVGLLSRSRYEYSHHVKIAMDFGASETDIHALRGYLAGRAQQLGAIELAVLDATRELVEQGTLAEHSWTRLGALLERDALIDLVATVSYYCMVVRLLAAFEVDVEPEYQTYLERFPIDIDEVAG